MVPSVMPSQRPSLSPSKAPIGIATMVTFNMSLALNGVSALQLVDNHDDQSSLMHTMQLCLSADQTLAAYLNVTIVSILDNAVDNRRLAVSDTSGLLLLQMSSTKVMVLASVDVEFRVQYNMDQLQYASASDSFAEMTSIFTAVVNNGNFVTILKQRAAINSHLQSTTSVTDPEFAHFSTAVILLPSAQPTCEFFDFNFILSINKLSFNFSEPCDLHCSSAHRQQRSHLDVHRLCDHHRLI